MSSPNPFETPQGVVEDPVLGLSTGIIDALRKTRPWVLMMGILCFIAAAFTILAGIGLTLVMATTGGAGTPGLPPVFGIGMGVMYLVMGILYVFPGVYLMRYASKISALTSSPSTVALEEALIAQKSFWKFVGVSVLVVIGFYILIVVVVMAGAMVGFAGGP